MTPTEPGKPSLAERIEALAASEENVPLDADLRAIAAELREIAESTETIAEALGMHGGRPMKAKDQDRYADRLYAIVHRLAGKEGT